MAKPPRQKGNTTNSSQRVPDAPMIDGKTGQVIGEGDMVTVDAPAPVKQLDTAVLRNLGATFNALFLRYAGERIPAEQKWLKNLRQYLGVYDPEVERQLAPGRSRAYPRLTRVKCISMLSRLMNLMFPGNEDNWELGASPSPEMSPEAVASAVQQLVNELNPDGSQPLTQDMIDEAVRRLADKQAEQLTKLIKDQLMELGGGQTVDWIALNRKICDSGIKYGIGVLEGPYVRKVQQSGWALAAPAAQGQAPTFEPVERTIYKPQYDHLPVWDFFPDMSARDLPGEGYFVRKILGRAALRKLADRPDFFEAQIKQLMTQLPGGNYRARSFETELRSMGLAVHADQNPTAASGREKYEVIIWKGPVSARMLADAGAEVPEDMMADDVTAELWMVDSWVIKAEVNAWKALGVDVPQVHIFQFDEDDTSPIGQGLPGVVRDSQLSICAATRMTLDNASITCGPNLEVNTKLMRTDQDITSIVPWKMWFRDDDDPATAMAPAVRAIPIDGHLGELQNLIKLFLEFAEVETFIGPSTGGDFSKMPSEPMRTAAGASALRGDAALPFKDIVRNYDSFTQSVIWSLVMFNKKFNPDQAPEGDYDVIPRGATSLIAKEVRGMQIDQLSQTLTPDERDHIDDRKFVEGKFAARDMQGMLVSADEAKRRKSARADEAMKAAQGQEQMMQAQLKKLLAEAFKNVSQGQKNAANADAVSIDAALKVLEGGTDDGGQNA